jgi:transcription antitermination factor NusG
LTSKWYALGCKAHKEVFIWKQLVAEGYDVFFPRISTSHKNDRKKPFFPRYLFVHLDLEITGLSKFNNMPHTSGLVSIEGKPFHIPDAMIEAIRKRIKMINTPQEQSQDQTEVQNSILFSNLETLLDAERTESERFTILNRIFTG